MRFDNIPREITTNFSGKENGSTSSASPTSPVRFIKRREEKKTMQLTNLTFHTPKGMGFLALMFVTDEFVSCGQLWRIQPKENGKCIEVG